MTALAITGDVSIITMRDTAAGQPAWTTMFGWPETADTHIGFDGSRNWRRDGAERSCGCCGLCALSSIPVEDGAAVMPIP